MATASIRFDPVRIELLFGSCRVERIPIGRTSAAYAARGQEFETEPLKLLIDAY